MTQARNRADQRHANRPALGRPSTIAVGVVAAVAVALIPLAALMAQPASAPFTVVETNRGYSSLQAAVDAIGSGEGSIAIAPGTYRQCVVQQAGRVASLDFWEPAKKLLSDTNFLQSLLEFNVETITSKIAEQVRPYLSRPEYEPERVRKASIAACGLCKWVRAIVLFHGVHADVEPKRRRLQQAAAESAAANQRLAEAASSRRAVIAKLELIEAEHRKILAERDALQQQIRDTTNRLQRATKLIGGLGGERTRWSQRSKELSETYRCLVGDVTVAAAMVTYLGPFEQAYRADAQAEWLRFVKGARDGLRCSPTRDYSLVGVLGDLRCGD